MYSSNHQIFFEVRTIFYFLFLIFFREEETGLFLKKPYDLILYLGAQLLKSDESNYAAFYFFCEIFIYTTLKTKNQILLELAKLSFEKTLNVKTKMDEQINIPVNLSSKIINLLVKSGTFTNDLPLSKMIVRKNSN